MVAPEMAAPEMASPRVPRTNFLCASMPLGLVYLDVKMSLLRCNEQSGSREHPILIDYHDVIVKM